MSEVEHVQLPLALDEMPLIVAQLDKISNIIGSFDYVLNCDSHDYMYFSQISKVKACHDQLTPCQDVKFHSEEYQEQYHMSSQRCYRTVHFQICNVKTVHDQVISC
ncbi:hypothetical protein BCR43DRAFT_503963 [Syncephalastrum racemosum]|uniref:Uncharacterized protein n=1 Tax=Syncephalastrum racemosum TaxID=13706 RepID=A0A1X2HJI4_SYNRA|nr:hypothetical protein BCR43DRAFT_503963 [Syncephalastrum racemosum]